MDASLDKQCFSLLLSLPTFTGSHDFSLNIGTRNSWESMWNDWKEQQLSYRKVSTGPGESLNSDLTPGQGKTFLQSLLHHCTFAGDRKAGQVPSPCQGPVESECLLEMPTSSGLIFSREEPSDSVSPGKRKHVCRRTELSRASI